jgi:hypothetical protein
MSIEETSRGYIQAIESGATGDVRARFFVQNVEIREMPNRISPHGLVSDLSKALHGAEHGNELLSSRAIPSTTSRRGDRVGLEINWLGFTRFEMRNLPPGRPWEKDPHTTRMA